jgi:ABC-2 type transport system permease protein
VVETLAPATVEPTAGALRRNARLYRHLAGARIRSDLQYRASLALFTFGTLVITGLDFVAIAILFVQVPALAGWDLAEIAFLYGTSGVSFGLADMAVGSIEKVSERIRRGTFDILLLRPAGTLLQVVTDDFALRRIGKVAQPAAVLAYGVARLDTAWDARTIALTVVMVLAGSLIAGAIWVTSAAATFWTVEGREAANAVTYGGSALTQYPLPLYGEVVRSLAFVIPIAFISYLPSVEVLGKDDPLGVPAALRYASPVVAVASLAVATVAWRFAVRHYRSTGS